MFASNIMLLSVYSVPYKMQLIVLIIYLALPD